MDEFHVSALQAFPAQILGGFRGSIPQNEDAIDDRVEYAESLALDVRGC